ncbi:uncharacterized protein AUP68_11067 [Ilyonectria robusta]
MVVGLVGSTEPTRVLVTGEDFSIFAMSLERADNILIRRRHRCFLIGKVMCEGGKESGLGFLGQLLNETPGLHALPALFGNMSSATSSNNMSSTTSSNNMSPKMNLVALPYEVRTQIFQEYFKVDGGYIYNGESENLITADRQPIDFSLRYTCHSIAEDTRQIPLAVNTITFSTVYRQDWRE